MALNQKLERIDGLHPMLRRPAQELLARCYTQLGVTLMVVYGWRSVQEQTLIYQEGRRLNAMTGLWEIMDATVIKTRALPGNSPHNVISVKGDRASMALDVVPLLSDGTANWDVTEKFCEQLYEIAWRIGLDPLGDSIGAYLPADKLHFEEPAWRLKISGLDCIMPVAESSVKV